MAKETPASNIVPLAAASARAAALDLDECEIQLLQFASEGFVDKQAAEAISMPHDHVHERWRRIRRVLNATTRAHAVAVAINLKIIPGPRYAPKLERKNRSKRRGHQAWADPRRNHSLG